MSNVAHFDFCEALSSSQWNNGTKKRKDDRKKSSTCGLSRNVEIGDMMTENRIDWRQLFYRRLRTLSSIFSNSTERTKERGVEMFAWLHLGLRSHKFKFHFNLESINSFQWTETSFVDVITLTVNETRSIVTENYFRHSFVCQFVKTE